MERRLRVLTVFGTRPEAIKMCPLVKELKSNEKIESIVCVTGQHREMLDQVLEIFHVVPDYDLDIMKESQTLTTITSSILVGIENVLLETKPDLVLVHGDTSTSFIVALAAFYQQIVVGHVEAGLRSYNPYSPFPEEMNRSLIGRIATLHFAPTKSNVMNLYQEGIKNNVYLTGNTVIDSFKTTVQEGYRYESEELIPLQDTNLKVILVTAHRRENIGEPLVNLCLATLNIVKSHKEIVVVYPVHRNPKVQTIVRKYLENKERIYLVDPLNVKDMHNLMKNSYLVVTDSGGLQEEAPSFGIPVVVIRKETERPEAVEAGTVVVAGTKKENIEKQVSSLLENESQYESMAHAINPYGDGHSCKRIVNYIMEWAETKFNQENI